MRDTDALAAIRVALKGARGLALDNEETALDAELGRAIDLIDELWDQEAALRAGGSLDEAWAEVEALRAALDGKPEASK